MQENIDYSSPDDGLGDKLRNAFIKVQNNFTELYNGKVDKVTGKGLSENDFTDADKSKLDGIEAGAQVNVQADAAETDPLSPSYILNFPPSLYSAFGYFHYADLDTKTTPLNFVASTPLQLINDTLGVFTNEDQAPYGISSVWDKPTDSLDFSQLSVGDAVLFRADLSISTTSVNQNLQLYIKFGIGTPSEYDLLIDSWNEKSVVSFKHFIKDVSFSIDNTDWRDAPAKIYLLSDDDGSVKVNGWYIPIIRKSLNIIDFNSDPLKLDKVSTAGVERAYIINADGSQGTKATSEFGGSETLLQVKGFATDFPVSNLIGTSAPMSNIALASGTADYNRNLVATTETGHTGLVALRSSTSINSGFCFFYGGNIINNGDKHVFFTQFKLPTVTDIKGYVGFHFSSNTTEPATSCFLEIVNNTGVFKTRGSALTTASTSFTLSTNTWYNLMIEFKSTTEVYFKIKLDNGTVVADFTSTTNLPSSSVAGFSANVNIFSTIATTARDLMLLDYVEYRPEKPNHLKSF